MFDLLPAIARLTQVFEELSIPYLIGGSVASSVYGERRSTNDLDIVADLRREQAAVFIAALEADFYVDLNMVLDAIEHRSSFNIIDYSAMYKVDVFVMNDTPWAAQQMERRRSETYHAGDEAITAYFTSVEDMILQKLIWFRIGGGVSGSQWRDVQGMLKIQAQTLDYAYLNRWAAELALSDLLAQAKTEAGGT